ncbi:pickpocket protein 28-like isoform X2 [Periplaneta americana]|uniref:pickpocket protein 28-like isoform X2 n=1 Tax=Periplaneta americana TaxID=6978 RepID=UPI0037E8744F
MDDVYRVRGSEYGITNRHHIRTISGSFDKNPLEISRNNRNPLLVQQYTDSPGRHSQPKHGGMCHSCNCKTCNDLFHEFCEKTTLHGLKFVGDRKLHLLERLFWTLAFILATLTASYFIIVVYNKWDETPVIVSIGARATQMSDIPFPAVTICTMNEARKTEANKIKESTNKGEDIFKKMLQDACNNTEKEMPIKEWDNKSAESGDMILKFMVTVRQSCSDMVILCIYAGETYNCSDIFNPSLTDEGICCSFNKVKREFIFRNPRDLSDLNVTFPMNSVDWNPEMGYPPGTPTGTLPFRPRGAGSHLGLTVVLNAETEQFYCSTSASVGFKLLLHNPVETPKIADYGSLIATGREYRVKIKPTITNSTNSLHKVREVDRQCAYSSDRYLRFYRTYTQRNCILECESNYTLSVCKCVPLYLPKEASTPICGKQEESCAKEARKMLEMRMVDESSLNLQNGWTKPVCKCLPGCNELSYSLSMTYGNIDSSYAKTKGYLEVNLPYNDSQLSKYRRAAWFIHRLQFHQRGGDHVLRNNSTMDEFD